MDEAVLFLQDLAVIMIAAALAGLLCRRIGLSPIVGYLVAGIVVGPFTPPHAFVTDTNRVQTLAQLGMVFLMFGIGLSFSLRRLQQLGLPVLFATAGTAFVVFHLARFCANGLGLERAGSVFFAGMLVVSSSAVIGKILTESGRTHEKSSQLALGITLCEDIVAIIMLTLLGSYVQFGGSSTAAQPSLFSTLALFGGFVLSLAIVGLLVVPRMLKRLSREATAEIETIFVAGLLFGLSLIVVHAGYSLALGAFLLGAIIGETPQRAHVERAFSGLRDFFGAIFFVAIGMIINVSTIPAALPAIGVATALALGGRAIAATTSLLLLGHDGRTAIRAGLLLTPLGEFSFIIAQLGVANAILPAEYLSVAVGTALITALVSPSFARHNRAIAERLVARTPGFAERAMAAHRTVLDVFRRQRESSLLWKLSRRRLIQIGVEIAVVSVALIFAEQAVTAVVDLAGAEIVPGVSTAVVCWCALGLLLLAPLIALWRNMHAMALILADYASHRHRGIRRIQPVVSGILQLVAALTLALWLWNFVPAGAGLWVIVGIALLLATMAAILWRRLIRVHSNLEIALEASLAPEGPAAQRSFEWMDRHAPWGLAIGEIALPDRFAWAGKSVGELGLRKRFGCSVIGIERQTFAIANPGPNAHLFPGDKLLVLGSDEQIDALRGFMLVDRPPDPGDDTFRDMALELVEIPAGSPVAGRTLAQLNWPRLLGVQVVGHERAGVRTLTPPADQTVEIEDRILALGTPHHLSTLRDQLQPPSPAET